MVGGKAVWKMEGEAAGDRLLDRIGEGGVGERGGWDGMKLRCGEGKWMSGRGVGGVEEDMEVYTLRLVPLIRGDCVT